jgi:hypothetical protein
MPIDPISLVFATKTGVEYLVWQRNQGAWYYYNQWYYCSFDNASNDEILVVVVVVVVVGSIERKRNGTIGRSSKNMYINNRVSCF